MSKNESIDDEKCDLCWVGWRVGGYNGGAEGEWSLYCPTRLSQNPQNMESQKVEMVMMMMIHR